MNWNAKLSAIGRELKPSAIRELLSMAKKPGVISFAGGLPDPRIFPGEKFVEISPLVKEYANTALQYGKTEGLDELVEFIADWCSKRYGFPVSHDNVVIVTGSQQAMDVIGKVFIDYGDFVYVEAPTYVGTLVAFRNCGARFVGIPMDEDGMIVDLLEEDIKKRLNEKLPLPKFIYVIPNFQNPSGRVLSLERRKKLYEIAERYDFVIVEDDAYGEIYYDEKPPALIKSMDVSNRVIYCGSFSKILAPGMRVGWIIGDKEIVRRFVLAKQGMDLSTSLFAQFFIAEFCRRGWLEPQIEIIRKHYSLKRNVMEEAIDKYLPAGTKYSRPGGGFFYWVQVEGFDTTELFKLAVEKYNVAYVVGSAFYPYGERNDEMRINFTYPSEEEIKEGIRRLGAAIKEILEG
ncbi:MAG: PLP-dependent aminotransferase family protein [Synergistetes bacterium]|nr:PLP-dependent aminotransferase family protein [Synergistota bacterium]MCX8127916.1 PLP-dependent aminotransferase family protein [Synergistota bacterium]MDW8192178.1 PLP-dependent aminotransferase family protein [Synergistota bacterium]